MSHTKLPPTSTWARRRHGVLLVFALLALVLVARAFYLQVFNHAFYRGQGVARHQRTVTMPANRGNLLDRHGEPLAISTPIQSVWGVPAKLVTQPAALREVAALLSIDADRLFAKVSRAEQQSREFVYLKRHVPPTLAERVMDLHVVGLLLQREYRRYYPTGRASSSPGGIYRYR